MSEQKKFRSLSGEAVQVALTNGHVTVVGSEWKPLPEHFHREAYARGCISEDMINDIKGPPKGAPGKTNLTPEERAEKIQSVIRQMVSENVPEKFTTTGLPRAEAVNEACGFATTAEERTAAFDAVSGE